MGKNPLAEVFGFPITNNTMEAIEHRASHICPFNNVLASCTKDKADNPLGVCSIYEGNEPAIICPIRFRENWQVAEDAAAFFFPKGTKWKRLTEVRLKDAHDKSAGNIDLVIVSYDQKGGIADFGAVEIQAVYITGNIRNPFEQYMTNINGNAEFDWSGKPNYPKPDYLSSSRKRLAPQLLYKGSILNSWGKKQAVALHSSFYKTLPILAEVDPEIADIAWLIYDLKHDHTSDTYKLIRSNVVYTTFQSALEKITIADTGEMHKFVESLQAKFDNTSGN